MQSKQKLKILKMEKELTDLEKLDALYRYAKTGQIFDPNAKNVSIYNVIHKGERRFEVYKDKNFYKLSNQTIVELQNELEQSFPYASVKMRKKDNMLNNSIMKFGKYQGKTLQSFSNDLNYIKFLLEKVENLTSNYKFYFKNILNNFSIFENNVVHLQDDSFEHTLLEADICHTDASYNYYYNKEYGCIAKRRYGQNDALKLEISGIKIDIHGVEFDTFK